MHPKINKSIKKSKRGRKPKSLSSKVPKDPKEIKIEESNYSEASENHLKNTEEFL